MLGPLRRYIVILASLAVVPLTPAAQPSPDADDPASIARPAVRVFTDKDGLPQNAINALAFDSQGYLWAATKDGAAVYNGREWRLVAFPPGLGSTWVQSILVASDGTAWFGTVGGGVTRFTGREWQVFTRESGLPGDEINALIESRSETGAGTIYAGTNAGVARYEGDAWRRLPAIGDDPLASTVRCLYESASPDGGRVLWAGLNEGGVARFVGGAWTRYTAATSGLPDDRVACLFETDLFDGRRVLVAGTEGGGLARFENGAWTAYTGPLAPPDPIVKCARETAGAGGSRTLWIGTPSGLARFAGGRWELLTDRIQLPVRGIWSLLDTPERTSAVGQPTPCPAAISVSIRSPTTSVSSFWVPSFSSASSTKNGNGLPATIGSTPEAVTITEYQAPAPGISPRGVGNVLSGLVT